MKIRPEYYAKVRDELLTNIKQICSSLPCPECAHHATLYMNNVTPRHVPTQQSFVRMLWEFHNAVNKRTGKPLYSFESMDFYKRVNLQFAFNEFVKAFGKPLHNPRLLLDSMNRTRKIGIIKGFMTKHSAGFSL